MFKTNHTETNRTLHIFTNVCQLHKDKSAAETKTTLNYFALSHSPIHAECRIYTSYLLIRVYSYTQALLK